MFNHLKVHSDYSFMDGACQIDRLVARAKELGYPAIALTDAGNLYSAVPFYRAAKSAGIKPIMGCELALADGSRLDPKTGSLDRITLWAANNEGYKNLMRLVSDANLRGKSATDTPRIDFESLAQFSAGLIGGTGDQNSFISKQLLAGNTAAAVSHAAKLSSVLGQGNLFVEVSNFGDSKSATLAPKLAALAKSQSLPLAATNDVRYLNKDEAGLYDTLTCIGSGHKKHAPFRPRASHEEAFLKSPSEMQAAFPYLPQAIRGTQMIADRCNVEMEFGKNLYPNFALPEGTSSSADLLRRTASDRLAAKSGGDIAPAYSERLDFELGVIEKAGFSDYYLVVSDIVENARKKGIPVGPGRGSGGGSLAAYAMGITNLDPIKHGLLFERFLNPERVSPPDFDIDFCEHRRGEVFDYVRQKYGADRTAQISTFGTFGTRGVVRDLARTYGVDSAEADQVAKALPDDTSNPLTLRSAYETVPEFRKEITKSPVWRSIYADGQQMEGIIRNPGRHAAGILIAPGPLTDIAPLAEQKGEITVQIDKDSVEKLGLLKLDLLGVSTISVIHDATASIRKTQPTFDLDQIPYDDPKTFELLRAKRTAGVFQLGSAGMTAACAKVGVENFNDLMAVISLYRPGPMQFIDQYAAGKKNPNCIRPPHPLLAETTKDTNGILIYQEQVMESAKKVAGFSLGEADILRKAMGKKDAVMMEAMKDKFIAGAGKNKIPAKEAGDVFETMEKFAGYGFNKSHAAGYAILAYQTAYLKANHPAQFMAAALTNKVGKPEEKARLLSECRAIHLPILPPDINSSHSAFSVADSPKGEAVRFGLANIKGVGEAAAIEITKERASRGPFKGVMDLAKRVDSKFCGQRTIETLIMAGAFDGLHPDRPELLGKYQRNVGAPEVTPGSPSSWEKDLLGQYVSNHPLDKFGPLPAALSTHTADTLISAKDKTPATVVGAVSSVERRLSNQDQRPWVTAVLETADGPVRATMFSEAYAKTGNHLREGEVVLLRGQVEQDPRFGTRLQVRSALDMTQATPSLIRNVGLTLADGIAGDSLLDRCRKFAAAAPGTTRLDIERGGQQLDSLSVKLKLAAFEQMLASPGVTSLTVSTEDHPKPALASPASIEDELAQAAGARNRMIAPVKAVEVEAFSITP